MLIPAPPETNFTPPPPGTHVAVCYRFIDLGTQEINWQGQVKKQHKILIGWELPTELMDDGRPFTVSKRYTWSMSDRSTLRHDLEAWRGRAFSNHDFTGPSRFDIRNILGKACLITVIHKPRDDGGVFANIASITALPKGMPAPAQINQTTYFALTPEAFDAEVFNGLSNSLKETIQTSPEYQGVIRGASAAYQNGGRHDDFPGDREWEPADYVGAG